MITAIDKNTALVLIDLQKGVAKMDVAHPIDLMIISLDAWKQFLEIEPEWFSSVPSLLIMRK